MYNFCLSKDIGNRIIRQPTGWEKILANHVPDNWLTSEYMKNLYNSTTKTSNWIKKRAKELRRFPEDNAQIATSHLRRCLPPTCVRKTQVKATMSRLTSAKTAAVEATEAKEPWACGGWKCKVAQPLGKPVGFWGLRETLKIGLPQDPVIPLLGIYPEELEVGSRGKIRTATLTAAFWTSQEAEAAPGHQHTNGQRKGSQYTQWSVTQPCHLLRHGHTLRRLWSVRSASHRRTNTVQFHLHRDPGGIEFLGTERSTMGAGAEGGLTRTSPCSMATEFQVFKMEKLRRSRIVSCVQQGNVYNTTDPYTKSG